LMPTLGSARRSRQDRYHASLCCLVNARGVVYFPGETKIPMKLLIKLLEISLGDDDEVANN
jgi:hypothetical protein